ncbi:glycosyltransferase [Algoriphagus persicinus]|uniref:glycosyltransferase n=1 Tax=Algoriphagus persicinus TaxID=3108754 RepID=UPI002B3E423F|nr:glycosyltransferase [Algoriphagus sp. E1-3-M2]MEB2784735.1 glycosyltransferase [Algoriphagus sp. E1-3-M2]
MSELLISIIVPCYNHGHFLKDSIGSVLNQNYSNWELYIINDGSTDDTLEKAHKLTFKDNRIRVLDKTNGGLSPARNLGLENVKGELICFLDADDKLLPNALLTISTYFIKDSQLDVLVCSYKYFKENGDFHIHVFNQENLGLQAFFKSNIAPPVSFFLKRSCQERIGIFDESLKSCEDWDFWIRAAKVGAKIETIPDVLVGYRYVPNSMSRNAVQMFEALKEVSLRAVKKDSRIDPDAPMNKDYPIDAGKNLKHHFLRCLGVYLMQGKVNESVIWYTEEKEKWNWNFLPEDFEELNSNLSFRYFLKKEEIDDLLKNTLPDFERFFSEIGLSKLDQKIAIKKVFAPHLKKNNHYRFGKWLGALVNRLTF